MGPVCVRELSIGGQDANTKQYYEKARRNLAEQHEDIDFMRNVEATHYNKMCVTVERAWQNEAGYNSRLSDSTKPLFLDPETLAS